MSGDVMDHELLASNVDAIYAVPREDFTGERDRRAKQLRAEGHREEAAALRAHRKPTVPAWVVDQLARRHRDEVAELIAAGDELRDVQRRATSGRGGAGLREATQRVRGLVSGLRDHARELLETAGSRPDAHLDEVEQTLFAAAVDPPRHDTLRRGVFGTALAGAGFGGVEGLLLVGAAGTGLEDAGPTALDDAPDATLGASEDTKVHAPGKVAAEQERRRQVEEERLRQAELRRAAQRRELEQRRGQLQRSRERQQRRTERAEATVAQLRARLADAEAEADEQRAARERIDQQLGDVQRELDALDG